MSSRVLQILVCLVALCLGPVANAWWAEGHLVMDEAAVKALPADMPAFFRRGGETIESYANDPDLYRDRALPALRNAGGPEHFFDLELLKGNAAPELRGDFFVLCNKLRIHPYSIGSLPYAILENSQKLTYAFAEYRHAPENEAVRAKILYIAGILSHYTGDATQPLHCTVHYDGRANPDGSSPRTGIHAKVDALPGRLGVTSADIAPKRVTRIENVFARAMEVIRESNDTVDAVYAMEGELPEAEGPMKEPVSPAVRRLTAERLRTGAALTAAVWYTAWLNSVEIELPAHHPLKRMSGAE